MKRLICVGIGLGGAAVAFQVLADKFGVATAIFSMMIAAVVVFMVVIAVLGIHYEATNGREEHWSSRLQRQSRERSSGSRRSSYSGGGSGRSSSSSGGGYTDYGAGLD